MGAVELHSQGVVSTLQAPIFEHAEKLFLCQAIYNVDRFVQGLTGDPNVPIAQKY